MLLEAFFSTKAERQKTIDLFFLIIYDLKDSPTDL